MRRTISGSIVMRSPITATAYRYTRTGDAGVMKRHAYPLPAPRPGEVSVQVVATGINHIESFIRSGAESDWHDEPWPRSSGSDFAGIVRAVPVEGSPYRRGDEVIGHVRAGAHATHLNIATANLVPRPRSLGWEVAAGLYLAGATAIETLDDLSIGAADTIVVSAAAGGVGSIEVQLAKRRGARVIGTCGERNFDYLRQLGVIPVRYGAGIAERIRTAARGPVTAFIDNYGKDGSDIADELGVPEDRRRSSADRRDIELRLLRDDADSTAQGTELLRRAAAHAANGDFRLLVSGIYHLEDIAEAYDDLTHLHSRGKVVLVTSPVSRVRTLRAREVFERSA